MLPSVSKCMASLGDGYPLLRIRSYTSFALCNSSFIYTSAFCHVKFLFPFEFYVPVRHTNIAPLMYVTLYISSTSAKLSMLAFVCSLT
jgi:hypothetical protein